MSPIKLFWPVMRVLSFIRHFTALGIQWFTDTRRNRQDKALEFITANNGSTKGNKRVGFVNFWDSLREEGSSWNVTIYALMIKKQTLKILQLV
jgi:hypothetical protein